MPSFWETRSAGQKRGWEDLELDWASLPVGNVHGVRAGSVAAVLSGSSVVGGITCISRGINGVRRHARTVEELIALYIRLNYIHPSGVARITSTNLCWGELLVVVLRILDKSETDLLEIGLAGSAAGIFASSREDGKQDGRQNRDDCDNYQ